MEWKWIQGCEGIHKVFFDGHIESDPAWEVTYGESAGYVTARIKIPSGCLDCRVHRIVALAFCEKREGCNVVNHLDRVRSNNHSLNLEWVTQAENVRHAISTGLNCLFGEGHGMSLVSEADILLIRASPMSVEELSSEYGLTKSGVRQILSGRTWRHLPMGEWRPQLVHVMSDSDRLEAVRLRAEGMSGCRIAKQLGYAASTVNCFLSGRSHKNK